MPLPLFKVLRFLQSRGWEEVARLHLTAQVSRQTEAILARYIVHHLERNLSSPAFLQRLQQQAAHVQPGADLPHTAQES